MKGKFDLFFFLLLIVRIMTEDSELFEQPKMKPLSHEELGEDSSLISYGTVQGKTGSAFYFYSKADGSLFISLGGQEYSFQTEESDIKVSRVFSSKNFYLICPEKSKGIYFIKNSQLNFKDLNNVKQPAEMQCSFEPTEEKVYILLYQPEGSFFFYQSMSETNVSPINFKPKYTPVLPHALVSFYEHKVEYNTNRFSRSYVGYVRKVKENNYKINFSYEDKWFEKDFDYSKKNMDSITLQNGETSYYLQKYIFTFMYNSTYFYLSSIERKVPSSSLNDIKKSFFIDYLPTGPDIIGDFQILSAKFLKENSRFFYYEIVKDDVHFVGVVDAMNVVLVSSVKIDKNSVVGVKDERFIVLSDKTYYCPFSPSNNCELCFKEEETASNNYFLCGETEKDAVSDCVEATPQKSEKLLGVYRSGDEKCVGLQSSSTASIVINQEYHFDSICPFRFMKSSAKDCTLCASDESSIAFVPEDRTCSTTCKSGYIKKNGLCLSCFEAGMYTLIESNAEEEKCVEKCENAVVIEEEKKRICRKCGEGEYYYSTSSGGSCTKSCADLYMEADDKKKVCVPCGDKYFYKNKCVNQCDPNLVKNEKLKICESCSEGEVVNDNSCVKECPSSKIKAAGGYCQACEANQFAYYDVCLKSCQENTIKEKNYCINCYRQNKTFFFENKCVQACPSYTVFDSEKAYCFSCKEKYFYESECFSSCPNGTVSKIYTSEEGGSRNYCEKCKAEELVEEDKCVSSCSEGYIREGVSCISCQTYLKKYQKIDGEGKCVDDCQGIAEYKKDINSCRECPEEKKYLEQGVCVSKCSADKVSIGGVCGACEEGQFWYDNKCNESCMSGLVPNSNERICVNCADQDDYYYEDSDGKRKCVNECPTRTTLDVDKNACQSCKDNEYYYEKKCLAEEKLPENISCSKDTKICKNCSKEEYISNRQCLKKCPEYQVYDEFKVCRKCEKFFNLETSSCIEECPKEDNVETDSENNVCRRCEEYYYENKCYDTKCPAGTITPREGVGKCIKECEKDTYWDFDDGKCYTEDACQDNHGYVSKKEKLCLKCDAKAFLFYDRCVDTCPSYTIIDQGACTKCEIESPEKPYNYDGGCVKECPKGTFKNEYNQCIECGNNKYLYYDEEGKTNLSCITMEECRASFYLIDEKNSFCQRCRQEEFLDSTGESCVSSCGKYSYSETNSNGSKRCVSCKRENKFLYNNNCYNSCDEASKNYNIQLITDTQNNICLTPVCSFECLNGGQCDEKKNTCDCKSGYTGTYCELKVGNQDEKMVKIILEKFDNDDNVIFTFNTEIPSEKIQEIVWDVKSIGTSLNGENESIVKIPIKGLPNGDYTISVRVSTKEGASYEDKIVYQYEIFDGSRFDLRVTYGEAESIFAMKTKAKIIVEDAEESASQISELKIFQFFFFDIYNDELPLTEENYVYNFYEGLLPMTSKVGVKITDAKGRKCIKTLELSTIKFDPFDQTNLSQVISNDKINNNLKLLYIYNSLMSARYYSKTVSESDLLSIKEFSESTFEYFGHSKTLISILNALLQENDSVDFNTINSVEKIMTDGIKRMRENKTVDISNSELKGYFRNVDNILSKANSVRRRLRVLSEEAAATYKDIIINTQKAITSLNTHLSRSLVQGESVTITGVNYQTRVVSPSKASKPFSISKKNSLRFRRLSQDDNDINSYSANSSPSSAYSTPCNYKSDNLFCIEGKDIKKLQERMKLRKRTILRNLGEDDSNDDASMSIGLVEVDNTEVYQYQGIVPITNTTVISNIFSDGENVEEEEGVETESLNSKDVEEMKYVVSYDVPEESYIEGSNSANCSCVSFSLLKSPKPSVKCQTYFDYENHKTICKCTGTGEIVPVWDYTLTSLAKLAQFPPLSGRLFNAFNTTFILASLLIISMFSLVLLIMDYKDDNKYKPPNAIDIFIEVKDIHDTNLISLSWVATSFTYPFLSVLFLYNYNQPRFFRFLLQIFSSLVSIVFSSISFYRSEFTYKELYIDKRDIETINYDIHNLPAQINDIVSSLVYSIVASIISNLLVIIFEVVLRYNKLLLIFWKERKCIISEYVRMNFIYQKSRDKDEMFRRRFGLKCRAVVLFGENFFKKEQIKVNRDVYLKRMREELGRKIILEKERQLSKLSRSVSPQIKRPLKHKNIPKLSLNSTIAIPEITSLENSKKDFSISEEKNFFTLNRFTTNIEQKEERKLRKSFYVKLEARSSKALLAISKEKKKVITYNSDTLEIEYGSSFTFFNIKYNTNEESKKKSEICKMITTLFSVLILCGLFGVVYFYIFIIFGDIYERYEFYIVKSWLLPSLVSIIVLRLFIVFGQNLAFMICIKLLYQYKSKSCLVGLLFNFVVPRYLVSIYKVRGIVNKYYYDFRDAVKKIKGEEYALQL